MGYRLDLLWCAPEDISMVIQGHVQNGVVILEQGSNLPEGATVTVWYPGATGPKQSLGERRIEVPLVPSNEPGSVRLTNERIAQILDEEDASA